MAYLKVSGLNKKNKKIPPKPQKTKHMVRFGRGWKNIMVLVCCHSYNNNNVVKIRGLIMVKNPPVLEMENEPMNQYPVFKSSF